MRASQPGWHRPSAGRRCSWPQSVLLFVPEIGDRWRYLHRPPAPWMPLLGLGFDGRVLLLGLALLVGQGFAVSLLVGGLVLVAWVVGLVSNPWRPVRR